MPRDAATVMLLRDGDRGLEVFMLRRNPASVFAAGAHVFPGGAVDDSDRRPELEALCAGWDDAQASAVLGLAEGGLAFWVAAIRECFEEAGVLLAHAENGDGSPLSLADPVSAARFRHHRARVYAGELSMAELCRAEGLFLSTDRIHYVSHWITPAGAPRRYDTRFFVAAAPADQEPWHDAAETVAHEWVRPADALARFEAGGIELILPTVRSLEGIGRHERVEDVLAACRA